MGRIFTFCLTLFIFSFTLFAQTNYKDSVKSFQVKDSIIVKSKLIENKILRYIPDPNIDHKILRYCPDKKLKEIKYFAIPDTSKIDSLLKLKKFPDTFNNFRPCPKKNKKKTEK